MPNDAPGIAKKHISYIASLLNRHKNYELDTVLDIYRLRPDAEFVSTQQKFANGVKDPVYKGRKYSNHPLLVKPGSEPIKLNVEYVSTMLYSPDYRTNIEKMKLSHKEIERRLSEGWHEWTDLFTTLFDYYDLSQTNADPETAERVRRHYELQGKDEDLADGIRDFYVKNAKAEIQTGERTLTTPDSVIVLPEKANAATRIKEQILQGGKYRVFNTLPSKPPKKTFIWALYALMMLQRARIQPDDKLMEDFQKIYSGFVFDRVDGMIHGEMRNCLGAALYMVNTDSVEIQNNAEIYAKYAAQSKVPEPEHSESEKEEESSARKTGQRV